MIGCQQAPIGHALRGELKQRGERVRIGRGLAADAWRLSARLRYFDLLARFRELCRQIGDAAAFDPCNARCFDGRRGFIQSLLEQGILGSRQKPLVNLLKPAARDDIGGIARLRLPVEFQRVVARGFGQPVGRQRRRRAQQQR